MTYKDVEGVKATLRSVQQLCETSKGKVEVIVQDGATGPEFDSVHDEFGGWADIQSRQDNGIYDGMNAALHRSRGAYVWFLNGGDLCSFQDWSTLSRLLLTAQGRMVWGAYDLDVGNRIVHRTPRPMPYIYHGLPTSHQAILYPGEVVRQVKYDLKYKVVGDYALTAALKARGVQAVRAKETLAVFKAGGMSQQHASDIAREASIVQRQILRSHWILRVVSSAAHAITRNWRRIQTTGSMGSS